MISQKKHPIYSTIIMIIICIVISCLTFGQINSNPSKNQNFDAFFLFNQEENNLINKTHNIRKGSNIKEVSNIKEGSNIKEINNITNISTTSQQNWSLNPSFCGQLLVLMYHNVVPNKPNKYAVLLNDLEQDFVYLQQSGCNVISPDQLLDCVRNNIPLPHNAVMLTFDDGFYSFKQYVSPLLDKYNYSATFAIVGEFLGLNKSKGRPIGNYAYLDTNDLKELSRKSNIYFANHSYAMHKTSPRKGVLKLLDESWGEYKDIFVQDQKIMRNILKDCNITTQIYTYPFGEYNASNKEILQQLDYSIALTCNEGINNIYYGQEFLQLLRYNICGIQNNAKQLIDFYLMNYHNNNAINYNVDNQYQ